MKMGVTPPGRHEITSRMVQARGVPLVALALGPALNRASVRLPTVRASQHDADVPGETVVAAEDHRLYRGRPFWFTLWA